MGSHETAVFRPALVEMLTGSAGGEDEWCAAFTNEDNPDAWIQVTPRYINCAYPHSEEPDALLTRIALAEFVRARIDDWEANSFVTLAYESDSARSVAAAVDRLFATVLDCAPGFPIDVEVYELW